MWKALKKYYLRIIIGPFFSGDDIPGTLGGVVDGIESSGRRKTLIRVLSVFWFFLFGLAVWTSFHLLSSTALFNVVASTETLTIRPFSNQRLSSWNLGNAEVYEDCDQIRSSYEGEIQFGKEVEIILEKLSPDLLRVSIWSDSDSVGKIELKGGGEITLSDCEELLYKLKEGEVLTFPVDGVITLGGEVKEARQRFPVLLGGTVNLADKALLTNDYFISSTFDLDIGDRFQIKNMKTQNSGFVYVESGSAIQVAYRGIGESGVVDKYKSESIIIANGLVMKFFKDQTLVVLWGVVLLAFAFVRGFIRFSIERPERDS